MAALLSRYKYVMSNACAPPTWPLLCVILARSVSLADIPMEVTLPMPAGQSHRNGSNNEDTEPVWPIHSDSFILTLEKKSRLGILLVSLPLESTFMGQHPTPLSLQAYRFYDLYHTNFGAVLSYSLLTLMLEL